MRKTLELDDTDNRPVATVGKVWSQRLAEESSWEGLSDCHRLEADFVDLNNRGMVASMNLTCCNTCGRDEIDDVRHRLRQRNDIRSGKLRAHFSTSRMLNYSYKIRLPRT